MNRNIKLFWHNFYLNFRHSRDKWLAPVSNLLIKWKVSANQLTTFRLILAFITPFLIVWNYWVVVFLLTVNLILDGVDGGIARATDTKSVKGRIYDLVVDNSTFLLFLLGLIFWKLVDGFWAAFYALNFVVLIFFGLQYHEMKKDGALMSKSRYVVLIAFLILVISGINWLDYACIFCAMYLFVQNIFLIHNYISEL